MPKLEDELNCEGYYGFGGGFLMARQRAATGGPHGEDRTLYCSALCTKAEICWYRHKGRVMWMWPVLTASFIGLFYDAENPHLTRDEFLARLTHEKHQAAIDEWIRMAKGASDPFSSVLAGNIEDGATVAHGAQPKDRGPGTLTFPFPPRAL